VSNFDGLDIDFDWVFGERSLKIRSERLSDLIDFAFTHDIRGLILNESSGFRLSDLKAIAGNRFVEAVLICGRFKDLSPLYELPNLRQLAISYSEAPFDPCLLPLIEKLSCEWTSGRAGIAEAVTLRELHLGKFKSPTKDLQPLNNLTNLEVLDLSGGNIWSLDGIESFGKLRRLELHSQKFLADIRALAGSKAPIEFLHMAGCSKVMEHEVVQHLSSLKILRMHRCGTISSLGFVKKCPSLRSFRFLDTDVADGKLSPLKKLDDVCFTEKKHFSHRVKDFANS
jgi:Leucine-rich repeat (LRR) protein